MLIYLTLSVLASILAGIFMIRFNKGTPKIVFAMLTGLSALLWPIFILLFLFILVVLIAASFLDWLMYHTIKKRGLISWLEKPIN